VLTPYSACAWVTFGKKPRRNVDAEGADERYPNRTAADTTSAAIAIAVKMAPERRFPTTG